MLAGVDVTEQAKARGFELEEPPAQAPVGVGMAPRG